MNTQPVFWIHPETLTVVNLCDVSHFEGDEDGGSIVFISDNGSMDLDAAQMHDFLQRVLGYETGKLPLGAPPV